MRTSVTTVESAPSGGEGTSEGWSVEQAGTRERHTPGETGIWLFVLGDMMVFAAFFVIFMLGRESQPEVFAQSRDTASIAFGAVNTLMLLTGSWFVASGVQAVRCGRQWAAPYLFGGALVTAGVFAVNKVIEWSDKIEAGHGLKANDYYTYFFAFTGVHFIHLLVGSGILIYMVRAARAPVLTMRHMRNIESGATYWHLVDLLWIVLFALLYLV